VLASGKVALLAVLASVAARARPAWPDGPLLALRLRAAARALLPFAARPSGRDARSMGGGCLWQGLRARVAGYAASAFCMERQIGS